MRVAGRTPEGLLVLAIVSVLVVVPALAAKASSSSPTLVAYPSSASIGATGPLPPGGSARVSLAAARGDVEAGIVVARGAHRIAARIDSSRLAPLTVRMYFAHYVMFGSRPIADALLPWDGSVRATEKPNQPIWIEVTVPAGAAPGTYRSELAVTADGRTLRVPLTVSVFDLRLPPPGQAAGNLLTSFPLSAQTYLNTVDTLYGLKTPTRFLSANSSLYAFLSRFRISPRSWGYGDPHAPTGYGSSERWWRNDAANAAAEVAAGSGFSALWVPLANNRFTPHTYVAGLSPFAPESWCGYLTAIRSFWRVRGWLGGTVPYVYGVDEPDRAGERLVARQASVVHRCFAGAKVLVTANPSPAGANRFLWTGSRRVDVWAVLANRFYGSFTVPRLAASGRSRQREKYRAIANVRSRGAAIWAYTYAGTGTPGFLATERLSDARMLFLWAALEDVRGILYGEGTTAYQGDPLARVSRDGAYVLLYPGADGPVPSARLEQIRDGIEDWAIFAAVRRKLGAPTVRRILGRAGLFSADANGVALACTIGCDLRGPQPNAWPRWSHDASTPRRIERAKLLALRLASS